MAHENILLIVATRQITLCGDFFPLIFKRNTGSNCQHLLNHRKSQGIFKKSTSLIILKPLSVWITTNRKVLKDTGIPDHLTCPLTNLYAGQEATVRTGHETTDWFQIGKGEHQGCILSPCLLIFYAEHSMRNAGPDES